MIYESSTSNTAVLPNDWSTVMGEFFADDYHSGQNCKICDATGSTISFLKFARDMKCWFHLPPCISRLCGPFANLGIQHQELMITDFKYKITTKLGI